MQKRHVFRLVILLLIVAVGVWFRSTSHVPPPATAPAPGTAVAPSPGGAGTATPSPAATGAPGGAVAHPEIGFGSPSQLIDHFSKHGAEVHAGSESEYLAMAQRLRDRAAGGDVVEATRADGTRCRFDRANGTFLAFDPDLTIRTFFRPNDGEAYFRRQLERQH